MSLECCWEGPGCYRIFMSRYDGQTDYADVNPETAEELDDLISAMVFEFQMDETDNIDVVYSVAAYGSNFIVVRLGAHEFYAVGSLRDDNIRTFGESMEVYECGLHDYDRPPIGNNLIDMTGFGRYETADEAVRNLPDEYKRTLIWIKE